MERILNDDERIRRAEEIYFRRNNRVSTRKNANIKPKDSLKNKMLFNLLVMFNLAVIVFAIQNKDDIFKTEFLEKINNYNFSIGIKIKEFLKNGEISNNEDIEIVENEEVNSTNDEIINQENINEDGNNQEANNEENVNENLEEKVSSISEMEIDINNLKSAYSFIKPLSNYQVSSGFGARESEYQNVSGYHTGIDLAAESGTTINATMEGIVDLVSKEGDYGKHIKIRSNNVTTLYAHCSKILVKEGQIVAQGQPIAEVGSTGNSTGPHLHFEIRVDSRFVDPSKIIEF